MNKIYAMIVDGNNAMSCSLPYPLVCPNCNNDYWIVSGVDDVVKLSQKCTCKNQMPTTITKPDAAEPDAAEPDAAEPDAAEPDAAEPDAAEPDAAEPKPSVW